MRVIYSHQVTKDLTLLIETLYNGNYFSYKESAIEYVEELVYEIDTTLFTKLKKKAPAYFSRYGNNLWYAAFKKNKHTTWYVFFNQEKDLFYIRYIGNNHVCSQYLES